MRQVTTLRQALLSRRGGQVGRLAAHGNPRAQATLARVYQLMGPPALLAHPALVAAALRAQARVRGGDPRPPGLAVQEQVPELSR